MANWTYNGIRIFVIKETIDKSQEIARLQPLRSDTVYHIFGWESPIVKLDGYVVGNTNAYNLHSFLQSGSSMNLYGPDGLLGSYFPKTINLERTPTIYQTFDSTQDCDAAVFRFSMELYHDV